MPILGIIIQLYQHDVYTDNEPGRSATEMSINCLWALALASLCFMHVLVN